MKRIRIVGFALVVVALCAVGVSAAFGATSEWLTKAGGSPAGVKFTGLGVGLSFFEGTGGNIVECNASESSGEFLSSTDADVIVKYSTGCLLMGLIESECPTITTQELLVTPGSADLSKTLRLVQFLPVSGSLVAGFTCGSTPIVVLGGAICHVPKFELSTKGEVVCHQVAAGQQEFTLIVVNETLLTDSLTAIAESIFTITEADAQNTTEVLTFSTEVEQMEGAGS
jgi:hypothetical protein